MCNQHLNITMLQKNRGTSTPKPLVCDAYVYLLHLYPIPSEEDELSMKQKKKLLKGMKKGISRKFSFKCILKHAGEGQ